jgi:hypothetical protein
VCERSPSCAGMAQVSRDAFRGILDGTAPSSKCANIAQQTGGKRSRAPKSVSVFDRQGYKRATGQTRPEQRSARSLRSSNGEIGWLRTLGRYLKLSPAPPFGGARMLNRRQFQILQICVSSYSWVASHTTSIHMLFLLLEWSDHTDELRNIRTSACAVLSAWKPAESLRGAAESRAAAKKTPRS